MKPSERVKSILDKYPEVSEEDKKLFIELFELLEKDPTPVEGDMQILHSAPHLFTADNKIESINVPKEALDEIENVLDEMLDKMFKYEDY